MALSDSGVDDTMASDWKAIQEKYAVEETEAPPEPADTQTEVVADPEPDTRPRDATGKFVKAEEKPDGQGKPTQTDPGKVGAPATGKPGAPDPAKGTTQQTDPSVPLADATGVRDPNRAPSSWKPAAREKFAALDPAIKAEIHRRESDFQAGQAQLLPDAQLGKGMRQVIEPYRMLIEAEGGTPERAVASLLRTAAIFRVGTPEQKLQSIAGIAQQYGIDLRGLVAQPNGQPNPNPQPQTFRDPRVDQILAQQQRTEAERQQRTQAEMETTVNRWMNEVDAQGNPTRPYISDVIGEMSALIPQIKDANPSLTNAQALEEAYNRAIWAHPEIRTLLQQKAAADLAAQRQADNQTRVREAKRAASVNVPRRASSPNPAKPGSLEETIASTARELGLIT